MALAWLGRWALSPSRGGGCVAEVGEVVASPSGAPAARVAARVAARGWVRGAVGIVRM